MIEVGNAMHAPSEICVWVIETETLPSRRFKVDLLAHLTNINIWCQGIVGADQVSVDASFFKYYHYNI